MRILDGKRNGHRAQYDQGSARHGSMEKSEMWRRIWAEMKIWAAAMEGIDDPQGELLAHLERRIQALEERIERLQLAQKTGIVRQSTG
ncbi:TolA-binding protein [Ochrobactrum intermedium]|uniref:TolA-binding protein n=1 Tax=Brucella intermedia TaxID=94625 RepID=A0ABR6AV63_9HYPH|nr:hypothetical protein [Brucella intermedia]MBA8853364.1 TolA-binding protein [Brucella intermedia]